MSNGDYACFFAYCTCLCVCLQVIIKIIVWIVELFQLMTLSDVLCTVKMSILIEYLSYDSTFCTVFTSYWIVITMVFFTTFLTHDTDITYITTQLHLTAILFISHFHFFQYYKSYCHEVLNLTMQTVASYISWVSVRLFLNLHSHHTAA